MDEIRLAQMGMTPPHQVKSVSSFFAFFNLFWLLSLVISRAFILLVNADMQLTRSLFDLVLNVYVGGFRDFRFLNREFNKVP